MRSMILLFALAPMMLLALDAASAQTDVAPAATSQPPEWCGFHDKSGARVRCGFVTQQDCEKALDDAKDAVCMPDPEFARNRPRNLTA